MKLKMDIKSLKVVALVSGGKDSCYNMIECVKNGHQIVALANLKPAKQGELDSYMYQTVGQEGISLYAEAMGVPLFRRETNGNSKSKELNYQPEPEDEVEDLYNLLQDIKKKINFDAVSSGAILSNYQRIRVENVCDRLNILSLAYLWERDQDTLLQEMIDNNVYSILIKTASLGLKSHHLGKSLQEMQPLLRELKSKFESNICGEGGEYETFTLDCPLFLKKIVIVEKEIVLHSDDGIVQVSYLKLNKLELQDKDLSEQLTISPKKIQVSSLPFADLQIKSKNISNILWKFDQSLSAFEEPTLSYSDNGNILFLSTYVNYCKTNSLSEEISDRTTKIFSQISDLVNQLGYDMSSISYINLYVSSMDHFSAINSAYKSFFTNQPPARVCVGIEIENLVSSQQVLFKFDCICQKDKPKKVMHIRSISNWAPANIGPYSQCTQQGNNFYVAGQIALTPSNMVIERNGIEYEALLSLEHVEKVLAGMKRGLSLKNIQTCVCYVTEYEYLKIAAKTLFEREKTLAVQNGKKTIFFVQILSLPRQAQIEWQVVAQNQSSSTGFYSVFFTATKSLESEQIANDVFSSLLLSFQNHLKNIQTEKGISSQIKLFYVKSNLNCHQAQVLCDSLVKKIFLKSLHSGISTTNVLVIPTKSILCPETDDTVVAVLSAIYDTAIEEESQI